MCSPGAAAGAQLGAGAISAYGQQQQGKMNESYYNYLANQSLKQVEQVDKATGEQLAVINADASRQNHQAVENANQTVAAQKAAMAANGVYSDSGTAHDVIGDTIDKQAQEEAAVKYNAEQAMWQAKRSSINQKLELYAQESSYRMQGSNARAAARINAMNTLVGSATQAGVSYYSMGGKFGTEDKVKMAADNSKTFMGPPSPFRK